MPFSIELKSEATTAQIGTLSMDPLPAISAAHTVREIVYKLTLQENQDA